jgi:uncharacterized protein Yka (UPF0111/DUF47 family)
MSGVIDLIIPKEKKFFEYLSKQVASLHNSSNNLYKFSLKPISKQSIEKSLSYVEKQSKLSDDLLEEITTQIHESFITPIDRDELHNLSMSIDNSVNALEKVINTLSYIKLTDKTKGEFFITQIKEINSASKLVKAIFDNPLKLKDNRQNITSINRFQKQYQKELRKALSSLFESKDPVHIIKFKDLYDSLSLCVDNINQIANIFARVLINHS